MSKFLHLFLLSANGYVIYLLFTNNFPYLYIPLIIGINAIGYFIARITTPVSEEARAESDKLINTIYEQQELINRLSAEREMALLINSEQNYKDIVTRSLNVINDVLSEFNVTSIVLLKTHNGNLELMESIGEPMPSLLVPPGSLNTLHTSTQRGAGVDINTHNHPDKSRMTEIADPDSLTLITPLSYNKNLIGYLAVKIKYVPEMKSFNKKLERLKIHLTELTKILSLVLKTENLYIESIEDALTGLASKRYFYEQLETFFAMSKRHHEKLTLLLIDIDDFKKINDTFGHLAGDMVLKDIAKTVKICARRRGDLAYNSYRYGGEEIAVLLPKTPLTGAHKVAERIRSIIEKTEVSVTEKLKLHCTCSAGITEISSSDNIADDMFKRADEALYKAKKNGKNRVEIIINSEQRILKS